MAISYDKLWHKLIDAHMTKTQMRHAAGISSVTLAKLSRNEPAHPFTMEKICKALHCDIGDVMSFVEDEPSEKANAKGSK